MIFRSSETEEIASRNFQARKKLRIKKRIKYSIHLLRRILHSALVRGKDSSSFYPDRGYLEFPLESLA